MKEIKLLVPEERVDEFVEKLTILMKECGSDMQEVSEREKYKPQNGEFIAFADQYIKGEDNPLLGIFDHFYKEGETDKIVCNGKIFNPRDGKLNDKEIYWNADTLLRPATDEEKEELIRAFAKEGKRWNSENFEFEDCPTYEAIRTFEDAVLATGITYPVEFDNLPADVVAYMKLRIIAAAINGLTETTLNEFPKFTTNEYRYYPWFVLYTQSEIDAMDEESRSRVVGRAHSYANALGGCVCAYANNASASSDTGGGARLTFIDCERARYAGCQFRELWADLYFKPAESTLD